MIIASAIQLPNGHYYIGRRHDDAIRNCRKSIGEEEFSKQIHRLKVRTGFVTDTLDFLDGERAYIHAVMRGQFVDKQKRGSDGMTPVLLSEDLW